MRVRSALRTDGDDGAPFDAGEDRSVAVRPGDAARIEIEQVGRYAVDGIDVRRAVVAAAVQQRLVVAGNDAGRRLIPVVDLVEHELALQESAHVVVACIDPRGPPARFRPCGPARQYVAARPECLPRFREIVRAPAGEIAEARRNKIRVTGGNRRGGERRVRVALRGRIGNARRRTNRAFLADGRVGSGTAFKRSGLGERDGRAVQQSRNHREPCQNRSDSSDEQAASHDACAGSLLYRQSGRHARAGVGVRAGWSL